MREQKDQKNKFVTVEGSIGVGKSTFLPKLTDTLTELTGEKWEQLQEPVSDPKFDELLRLFYEVPNTQNRINFQYYITDRRANMVQGLPEDRNYVLERSLLSDTIFCQVNMLTMERPDGVYLDYFYKIKERFMDYPRLDACVYLRTDPRIAFDRMQARGREAEKDVKYSYLEDLHLFHDAILTQECRVYGIPLMSYDWSHFGSAKQVAEELVNIWSFK